MADAAPISSRVAYRVLMGVLPPTFPNHLVDKFEVTTELTPRAGDRAITYITRPALELNEAQWRLYDEVISKALRRLPGHTNAVCITMGRTWSIEWDGIKQVV